MAKDFNVYQWRRNHLNEGNQNPSLKAAMEEWFGGSTPTKEEMINFVEWFYNQDAGEPSMIGLNEENDVMVSTITFEDLAKYGADRLPWDAVSGAFLEATRQKAFDDWKDRFIRLYGDSKLEVKNGRFHPIGNQKWDQLSQSGGSIMRAAVGTVD